MPPYQFLQAHVHEVETVVVPDDDITDDLNHGDDDLYDASYEMDPFDINILLISTLLMTPYKIIPVWMKKYMCLRISGLV
jgi:hypothetical protein